MNLPAKKPDLNIDDLLQNPHVHAEFGKVVGRIMPAATFARICLTTVRSRVKDLRNCTPLSILTACMEAAQAGVSTDVGAGEFYLVPYGQTCTGILGYRGMMRLMYKSGACKKIDAAAVFTGDEFDYTDTDDGPRWTHRHYWQLGRDKGEIRFAYAYAKLVNGETVFKVADQDQINRSRAKGNKGTWRDHEEAMTIKTAVRQLWKWVPKDAVAHNVASILDRDALRDAGETVPSSVSMDWARAYGAEPAPDSVSELQAAPGLEPDADPVSDPT